MKIYLVRHGEALGPEINPERPLSPQGREDVEKIGRFLAAKSFPLKVILHSGKARARETAEILAEYIAPDAEMRKEAGLLPDEPIEAGWEAMGEGDSMLVGHLPYLNKFVSYALIGDDRGEFINFQTGTAVCLESVGGRWIIDWVIGLGNV